MARWDDDETSCLRAAKEKRERKRERGREREELSPSLHTYKSGEGRTVSEGEEGNMGGEEHGRH